MNFILTTTVLLLGHSISVAYSSQQCVNDLKGFNLTGKYDEYVSLREVCHDSGLLLNRTDNTIEVMLDMTACDTSELRAFCDENFQTLELQPMVATCATKLPSSNNVTGGGEAVVEPMQPMLVTIYSYNIIDCIPKSCPLDAADWSYEDIGLRIGLSYGWSCTVELMKEKGAENESVAPLDPTPSAASILQLSWMFLTLFSSVAMSSVCC